MAGVGYTGQPWWATAPLICQKQGLETPARGTLLRRGLPPTAPSLPELAPPYSPHHSVHRCDIPGLGPKPGGGHLLPGGPWKARCSPNLGVPE